MKSAITLLACLTSLISFGQRANTEFDGAHWNAPYTLAAPFSWTVERSLIQKESFKGIEDIRYTPGWGNVKSEQYWSYGFLWYLDGSIVTSEEWIEKNLTSYYTDLQSKNIDKQNIQAKKSQPVKAWITEVACENGDLKTYHGKIATLDYMDQKPISLNCIIHVKMSTEQSKTFLFFEVSPQPLNGPVWKSLDQLWLTFDGTASEHKPKLSMKAYFLSESAVGGN